MRRNVIETVLGGVVLGVAGFFLAFAYSSADLRTVQGYPLSARFTSIAGLAVGADVRVSGVKVGTVTGQVLDPQSYLAVVQMSIDPGVRLPKDTVAMVASESLLGGKFMALEPGGETEMLPAGGRIEYTQSSPGLEQLLGQVIFSLQNVGKSGSEADSGAASSPAGGGNAAPGKPAAGGGLLGTP